MAFEVSKEFDAALLRLFLDAKRPGAIGAGTLYFSLHRLEVPIVLVVRVGQLADSLGASPVE